MGRMARPDVDPLGATVTAPSTSLSSGDVVADRYRIEAILGEGAMGVVYRVEHATLHKRFALKVLGREWANTSDAFARFEREAIAAAHIVHPHIAQATDFGRLADGSPFLVLEYVDGQTLRRALKRGPLETGRALHIARGIASALAAAHGAGVIHRDLKPENIMLVSHDGDADYVKVLDFGIAKIEEAAAAKMSSPKGRSRDASPALTRHGALMGTPAYMSPEQATGDAIDARSDLYAVGVILFEMLTGQTPFRGDPMAILSQHVLQEAPPLPPAVSSAAGPRVAEIVSRLLAKTPKERIATASELGLALDECLSALPKGRAGSRAAAAPPAPPKAAVAPASRRAPSSAPPAASARGDSSPPPAAAERASPTSPKPASPKPSSPNWMPTVATPTRRTLAGRLSDYVQSRRRRRRLRAWLAWPSAAAAWPKAVAESMRSAQRRRRVGGPVASVSAGAGGARARLGRTVSRTPWRRLAAAVAIAAAIALLVWFSLPRHASNVQVPPSAVAPPAQPHPRVEGTPSATASLPSARPSLKQPAATPATHPSTSAPAATHR
jgi:serine/threonine-protein kinase